MKKVFLTVWHYKVFILVAILVVVLVFFARGLKEKKKNIQPSQQANYNDIVPGVSSENDLKNKLGEPLKTTVETDKTILDYQSNSPVRFNDVIIKDGTVIFIKEIVAATDEKRSQDITNQYGVAPYTLYNQDDPNSYYYLFVYPGRGIAYLGRSSGKLLEIWYFQPTDISNFINSWASNYALTKSTKQVQ